ncbi:hypothetical protein R4Z10_19535 [Niallia sp. XMNu-256]|uniref:hypothetical protein n=1 Tax=Niallia sp. XMNu-256 TaxID=3082444 RepID=UPI0030D22393
MISKREVFHLLRLISVYYDSFDLQQEKIDEWCRVLKDETLQVLEENLRKHVAYSPFPPKVSDLLCKPKNGSRAIPNDEDTKIILTSPYQPASKEVVERSLAQIREILGIKRGED